ncbi:hypothetical protein V2A47_32905, partial [Pseudomonas aeruginosa]
KLRLNSQKLISIVSVVQLPFLELERGKTDFSKSLNSLMMQVATWQLGWNLKLQTVKRLSWRSGIGPWTRKARTWNA